MLCASVHCRGFHAFLSRNLHERLSCRKDVNMSSENSFHRQKLLYMYPQNIWFHFLLISVSQRAGVVEVSRTLERWTSFVFRLFIHNESSRLHRGDDDTTRRGEVRLSCGGRPTTTQSQSFVSLLFRVCTTDGESHCATLAELKQASAFACHKFVRLRSPQESSNWVETFPSTSQHGSRYFLALNHKQTSIVFGYLIRNIIASDF